MAISALDTLQTVKDLTAAGFTVRDREWLKIGPAGVLRHEHRIAGAAQEAREKAGKDVIVGRHLIGGRVQADEWPIRSSLSEHFCDGGTRCGVGA